MSGIDLFLVMIAYNVQNIANKLCEKKTKETLTITGDISRLLWNIITKKRALTRLTPLTTNVQCEVVPTLYSHMLAHPPTLLLASYASTLVFPQQLDLSQDCFLSFFMLWFQAIRCGTRGKQMHSSHFAPPCFTAMTSSSLSVSSLRFLKLLMDGRLYKQHSWLVCQLQTNAISFFWGTLLFPGSCLFGKHGTCVYECVTLLLFSAVHL